jgi:hypothetical protein
MTTNRRKTRRKALQVEVGRRLVPRLLELGYESTRTRAGKAVWGDDWKYYGYGRRRDGFVDLVSVDWEKWGAPIFKLQYSRCRQDEVDLGSRAASLRTGSVSPPLTRLERLFGRYRHWFGEWQGIEAAIDQAITGLDQLEAFFRSDIPGEQVSLIQSGDGRFIVGPDAPLSWFGWLAGVIVMPVHLVIVMLTLGHDRRPSGEGQT